MDLSTITGFGGMPHGGYVTALMSFALIYVALNVLRVVFLGRIKKITGKTSNKIDDIIVESLAEIRWPAYFFLSLYAGLGLAGVSGFFSRSVFYAFLVVATYYAVKTVQGLVDHATDNIVEKRAREEKNADVSPIRNMSKIFKALLWVVALLLILSNLGYDITALIAGLGIGGIAIALALQNILEDIFSSLSIYLDKPFVVGDFIIVGDDLGVVKKIGIKTTRIQHLQGQELVISNKELTSTRINNYGKMEKRRVSFGFGVLYQTPVEKMRKIPLIVKNVIEAVDLTTFDRAHFKEFSDSSLGFEVVYYVASSDYNKFMDIQQDINLGLMEAFEKEGVGFAYPTHTVYVNSTGDVRQAR